jgi:HPt (histidine-containing phosphotransfer) domain-containing protein
MDGANQPTRIRGAGAIRFPDDPEMAELAELFLEGLPSRIGAIRKAWDSGDLGQVRFGSHQLRGAAGGYGFPEIGEAAGLVEDLLRGSDPSHLEHLATSFEDLAAAIELLERRHREVVPVPGAVERRDR